MSDFDEIIAYGHASPAKIRNAMSNPITWGACIEARLIPEGNKMLVCSNDPNKIEIALGYVEKKSFKKAEEIVRLV